MAPSAVERLREVAPLMKLAVRTLEDEFHPGELGPSELAGALQPVAKAIDMKIV